MVEGMSATGPSRFEEPPSGAPVKPAPFYDGANYPVGATVGQLLHQVVLEMRRTIAARLAEHELTAMQWQPLWKLKIDPTTTAQQLARQMDVDAGAMTRMLDRLEAKGLIERVRSEADRRCIRLALTPAGEEVVQHVPFVLADVHNQFLRDFSEEEWRQLTGLLARLLANSPMPKTDAKAERTDPVAAADAEAVADTPPQTP
jgi:DNA-binding MarR family transcriptional regulator